MTIDGRFWLTKEGKSFLGSGRIELLEKIDQTGSIHAAAKAMKMSYKAAWERINGMNALADHPLIERTTGGRGGGGTKLTPYARELISTFHRFNELHRAFIDRFAEAGDDPERLARILSRTFLTTSARNQIPCTIHAIQPNGLNARLSLSLQGEDTLISIITEKSVKGMGLTEGCDAYAIIKSSDIVVSRHRIQSDDEQNILAGTIEKLETTSENIEITLRLDGGALIVALIMTNNLSEFAVGVKVYAQISSKHIIIGL